jgi:hypothetical protein
MFRIFFSLTIGLFSIGIYASDPEFTFLKETRSKIYFPSISNEEKLKIINFSKYLFENSYVNLEHKMKLYGVDPLTRLKEVELTYTRLSAEEFHHKILEIYNSVNDYHVNYYLPAPYGCYTSTLPVAMRLLNDQKVYISRLKLNLKEFFPELEKINVGDEILRYDHQAPLEVVAERERDVPASTQEAKLDQGIIDLYWRAHYSSILPKKNFVKLKLKRKSGETYKIKVPYLVNVDHECLKYAEPSIKSLIPSLPFVQEEKLKKKSLFWDQELDIENTTPTSEKVDLDNLATTAHQDLSWKIISFQGKQMAYIKLKSFEEYELGPRAAGLIRNLLLNELKNTDGLLFDLRGNYGGQIPFAEKLSALFTEGTAKQAPFYIRANTALLNYFETYGDSDDGDWLSLLRNDHESNKLIGPAGITSQSTLAYYKKVYDKTVAILINSECFSSCDIFAGIMKDNNKVTIYGTSKATFGGGANVWPSEIFQDLLDIQFEHYLSMRMTVRQSRRISDNSIIEDVGVPADVYLPETADDLINPKQSRIVGEIFQQMNSASKTVERN